MDAADKAEFDQAHDELAKLRATDGGAAALAHAEAAVKSTAAVIWTVSKPVLQAAGEAALKQLGAFAASMLEQELTKLANGGR